MAAAEEFQALARGGGFTVTPEAFTALNQALADGLELTGRLARWLAEPTWNPSLGTAPAAERMTIGDSRLPKALGQTVSLYRQALVAASEGVRQAQANYAATEARNTASLHEVRGA